MAYSEAVTATPVAISVRARRLDGHIFETVATNTSPAGVLFVHGRGSSQAAYATRAHAVSARLGAICLSFDLSGHGRDAARASRYSVVDHLEDVVAAYDQLAAHVSVDPDRIGVCGASYGGYLAALLTRRRHPRSLILRAPSLADSPLSVPVDAPDLDSLAAIAAYDGAVLVIESEHDEVIPSGYIDAYVTAHATAERRLIPDATHALTEDTWDRIFVDHIVDWFRGL